MINMIVTFFLTYKKEGRKHKEKGKKEKKKMRVNSNVLNSSQSCWNNDSINYHFLPNLQERKKEIGGKRKGRKTNPNNLKHF
jgi:hypothetical protein